jgi:hypothetical protein
MGLAGKIDLRKKARERSFIVTARVVLLCCTKGLMAAFQRKQVE